MVSGMAAQIQSTIPVLASLDLDESVRFYSEQLGFDRLQLVPGEYAIVARDGAQIHFWRCDERRIAEHTSCYVRAADVDALYQEFTARGVRIEPPQTRDWGMRELYVVDPHGNLLKFGQPSCSEQGS